MIGQQLVQIGFFRMVTVAYRLESGEVELTSSEKVTVKFSTGRGGGFNSLFRNPLYPDSLYAPHT